MKRILNCFKILADPDQVPDALWASGIGSGPLLFPGVKQIINPQDESALELSLRLPKDACELHALTLADQIADKTLRTLLALGYASATRIEDTVSNPFDAEGHARLLATYIQNRDPFDLIVMGAQSADGGNKKTALLLAESLGIPCYTQVTSFELEEEDGSCRITYQDDAGEISETISLPAVLAVGDVPSSFLRVPTLLQRRDCKRKPVVLTSEEVSSVQNVTLESLQLIDPSRAGRILEGKDVSEIANTLYEEYLKEVLL